MDIDDARTFIRQNPRGVQLTTRRSGAPQMSPILAAVADDGRLMVSSRETAYKVRNLRRDPAVSFCFLNDAFFGGWIQVDGTAEVVALPGAMDMLIEYYRRLSGEHDDWDDYRAAMERDRRVMILVSIDHAGPDVSG